MSIKEYKNKLNLIKQMDNGDLIKKIFGDKKPEDIEEVNSVVNNYVKELPYLEKNIKNMIQCRGSIIDMAIKEEALFNEIILLSDKPSFIKADFQKKVGFIKRIIRKIDEEQLFKRDFYRKLFIKKYS